MLKTDISFQLDKWLAVSTVLESKKFETWLKAKWSYTEITEIITAS